MTLSRPCQLIYPPPLPPLSLSVPLLRPVPATQPVSGSYPRDQQHPDKRVAPDPHLPWSSAPSLLLQKSAHKQPVARRSTFAEGLYSGLVAVTSAASGDRKSQAGAGQRAAKLQLLVEAPAAVEDALASLLNHIDPEVQVGCKPFGISAASSRLLLDHLLIA